MLSRGAALLGARRFLATGRRDCIATGLHEPGLQVATGAQRFVSSTYSGESRPGEHAWVGAPPLFFHGGPVPRHVQGPPQHRHECAITQPRLCRGFCSFPVLRRYRRDRLGRELHLV
jgi:hypothetical protein